MDAKPHRPLRPFRVRDENQLPEPAPGKVIHQRHKSSPAISALMQPGMLKSTATRMAFADVSNTAYHVGTRDDSAVVAKPMLEPLKENVPLAVTKGHQPLSKPAQRPMSISGLKASVLNVLSGNTLSNASKSQSVADKPADAPAPVTSFLNPKKTLGKKANFIYREEPVSSVPTYEESIVQPAPAAVEKPTTLRTLTSAPEPELVQPAPEEVEPPPEQITSQPPILAPIPVSADSNWTVYPEVTLEADEVAALAKPLEQISVPSLSLPKEDSVPQLVPSNHPQPQDVVNEVVPQQSIVATDLPKSKEEVSEELAPMPSVVKHVVHPLPAVPVASEREHFYTYDHEAEDYTAYTRRSLRSLGGDYTTGAMTILTAPKVTLKTQQEIMEAKLHVGESKQCDDLEEDEQWDISMVAEYSEDIFEYMRRLEDKMTPNPCYMTSQTELSWSMRAVLIDWIVQVHLRFGLLPETLFLCVNYIDRFLSQKVVSVGKLQLVGATAIFIAAKFEEINCPSIQEIHYMVDGGYSIEEILKAERFMLTMLDFELGWPGPMSFLRRVSKADEYDLETRTLAKYFLELTIVDERFVGCPPSYAAAGAHCLSRLMLRKGSWTPAHVVYSEYTYSQLEPLLTAMISCLDDPEKHHGAVFEKYADKRFKKASTYVQDEMRRGFTLPTQHRAGPEHPPLQYSSGYFFS